MNREADTRRRVFRSAIRKISMQLESRPNVGRLAEYKNSVAAVRNAVSDVLDDARRWRRRALRRASEHYCGLQDTQVDPSQARDWGALTNEDRKSRLTAAKEQTRKALDDIGRGGK